VRHFLLIFLILFTAGESFSLSISLKVEPETSKIFLNSTEFKKNYDQGDELLTINPNKAYRIALELQRIAIKMDKIEITFLADYFLAKCYYHFNDAGKALKAFALIDRVAEKNNWIGAHIKINTYLASTFQMKRNFGMADKYYKKALAIAKKYNKTDYLLDLYEKIGYSQIINAKKESFAIGHKYFKEGLKLAEKLKDTLQIAIFYTRLGLLGKNGSPTDSTVGLIHKSIDLLKGRKDPRELLLAYKSLGDAYYTLDKNDSSLFYYLEVYKIHKLNGHVRVSAVGACDVAYMYGTIGNIDMLNKYADSAVAYAKMDRTGEARLYVNKWLADIYKNVGKFEVSNKYFKQHSFLLDSILKSGNAEALVSAGLQSEFDGQLEVIRLNHLKEREIRKKEKDHQAFLSRIYLFGFFIVLIFLIIIFREFRINRKQKIIISQQHEDVSSQKIVLETKNKEITDSINYALRIQSALLPNPEDLFKLLQGSFIYYAPKDIVSGDFYWFYKRNNHIYIACGDCTGHGVPGALMSVLGINLLADIIDGGKADEPAKILDALRAGIIRSLNKDNNNGEYKDGMDISLVKIDTHAHTCVFAGANNPIYHISNGNLVEYKANAQPVGYSHKMEPFVQLEFKFQKNDHLVLFTDGFADQFGGKSNKKFMYKKFKEILVHSVSNNEANIEAILKKHFIDWKGQTEQVDDVCVLGIKL